MPATIASRSVVPRARGAVLKVSLERWPVHLSARDEAEGAPASQDSLPGALAQIYDAHFDFVWRNARRLGVPEANADDVTQDVLMIVQRRIADFDGRASMQAWIFGILVRVVRDYRRSFRRKGARHVSLEPENTRDSSAAPAPTPIELAERAERVRLLETLLSELDEDKRTLLILSELEQWTLREIAELFGSNTNTIFSRLRAAKRAFEQAAARWRAGKGELP
jgi:RNA polymerase sigma-70 factor, ECF subfamily